MKIDVEELTAFLPVFIPAIVSATLATCTAAAIGRSLKPEEIIEISDKVECAILQYINKLPDNGILLSDVEQERLANDMKNAIFENAWKMIQLATIEIENAQPIEKQNDSRQRI